MYSHRYKLAIHAEFCRDSQNISFWKLIVGYSLLSLCVCGSVVGVAVWLVTRILQLRRRRRRLPGRPSAGKAKQVWPFDFQLCWSSYSVSTLTCWWIWQLLTVIYRYIQMIGLFGLVLWCVKLSWCIFDQTLFISGGEWNGSEFFNRLVFSYLAYFYGQSLAYLCLSLMSLMNILLYCSPILCKWMIWWKD